MITLCLLQCIIMVSRASGVVATGCCPRLASSFTCKHMATLNMTENRRSWFLSSASIPLYRKWPLKVDILPSVLHRTLFHNIDHGKEVSCPVWFLPEPWFICLFVFVVMLSELIMYGVEWVGVVNSELERTWMEVLWPNFEVLSGHLFNQWWAMCGVHVACWNCFCGLRECTDTFNIGCPIRMDTFLMIRWPSHA
jgi:hypothetical protein